MNETQRKQVLNATEAYFVKAEKEFGRKFTRVPVEFNSRLTRTAGKAHYTRSVVSGMLTPKKLEYATQFVTAFPEWFIYEVTGHEVAHMVAIELYGMVARGHGQEWKGIMMDLGLQPERCHNKTLPSVAAKCSEFEYLCGCPTVKTCSQTVHHKMSMGLLYTCKRCKQRCIAKAKGSKQVPVQTLLPKFKEAAMAPRKALAGSKVASKADGVRELIRVNPTATVEQLITLVIASNIGIPAGNVKKYVVENIKRVRG